jgi:hypothetical protein
MVSVVFPWVMILPLVVAQALRTARGRGSERDHVVFLLAWALVTVAVVGLSHEQRLRYYLPLAPPTALLIGWWYSGAVVKRRMEQPVNWRLVFRIVAGLAVLASAVYPRISSSARPMLNDDVHELEVWGTPALPLAFYLGRSVTPVEAHLPLPALLPGHGSTIAVARASSAPAGSIREPDGPGPRAAWRGGRRRDPPGAAARHRRPYAVIRRGTFPEPRRSNRVSGLRDSPARRAGAPPCGAGDL